MQKKLIVDFLHFYFEIKQRKSGSSVFSSLRRYPLLFFTTAFDYPIESDETFAIRFYDFDSFFPSSKALPTISPRTR